MSDHNFSNQKSALEDYFESLLEDNDASKPLVPEIKAEVSIETEINFSVKDDAEEHIVKADVKRTSSLVKSRASVADMLANVEMIAAPEPEPQKEFAEPEPATEIIIPLPEVAEQVEVETEIAEEVVEVIAEPELTVEQVEVVEIQQETAQETIQEVIGPPEWAESRFQCLLFEVGGLSLAVPLVKLNAVIAWSEKIVETPNQTDWYLGVLMNHGNKVEVIDTAVMVLPAEHRKEMPLEPSERLSHILLVDDQKWGLACDSIGEVVWLKKDDVKWRTNRTKRPWLLGTAIEQMCAVMDTAAFADMLGHNK